MLLFQVEIDHRPLTPVVRAADAIELRGAAPALLGFAPWATDRAAGADGSPTRTGAVTAFLVDGGGTWLAAPDPSARQAAVNELTALIAHAGTVGVQRISVAPAMVLAGVAKRVRYGDALNHTADACLALERNLARAGVRLALRVSVNGFLTSPAEAGELLAMLNSPAFGVDLDGQQRDDLLPLGDWLDAVPDAVAALGVRDTTDRELIAAAEARGADVVVRAADAAY